MKSRNNKAFCIFLTLLLLTGFSSYAQHPTEPPLYDAKHAKDLIEIQPYVGVGISAITQNYSREIPGLSDLQVSPGCMMSAGLNVRFMIRNSFALATGLSFNINNSKYAMSLVEGNTGSINSLYVNNHFYNIKVPIFLTWRLNLARRIIWNIDFGAYMAWGTGGSTHVSGYTSGQNSLGQPIITHVSYNSKYFKDGRSVINGVKDFDWGPHIATGLTYNRKYSLNMVFEVSAPNLAINHEVMDVRYHHIGLIFEFGYNF